MIIGISGKIGSGKDLVGEIIQQLLWWKNTKATISNYSIASLEQLRNSGQYTQNLKVHSKYETKKFADKLKDIVCLLIGCTREELEDQDFKAKELGEEWWLIKEGNRHDGYTLIPYTSDYVDFEGEELVKLTPRKLLQLIGTDCGRDIIHPNIWVNSLMSEYNDRYSGMDIMNMETMESSTIHKTEESNWVITDMRFSNELEAVKVGKGITIRVTRDSMLEFKHKDSEVKALLTGMGYRYSNNDDYSEDAINEGFKYSKALDRWSFDENNYQEHESETALDIAEFDCTINNNGTIEELIEMIKSLLLAEGIL